MRTTKEKSHLKFFLDGPSRAFARGVRAVALAMMVASIALAGCGNAGGAKNSTPAKTRDSAPSSSPAATSEHFQFIVCGDPQNNYEVFNRILAAAKSVDFLIITGDETGSGTATEFQTFLNDINPTGVTYYCVPGNHDVATTPVGQNYTTYLGAPHRTFDHKGSHFVLIDNSTQGLGFYPQEQAWVQADLAAAKKKGYAHIFAACHVPPGYPYSATATSAQIPGIDANQQLAPILKTGKVEELFCGHVHSYLEETDDGLPVIISGGAGAPLLGIVGESYFNYVLVDVNGKQVTRQVVKI